ncbi:MAG: MoaD/ThiS family protein [Actinomycetota bacterium]|nr:MoaD/ThiS family protein [Actinomycetota bacterium]
MTAPRRRATRAPDLILVRYWAAARAAAGTEEEPVAGDRPVNDVLAELSARHGERLAGVLARCSLLLDGEQVPRDGSRTLPADGELDVLPPFAGG